jgi:hypothetical protein
LAAVVALNHRSDVHLPSYLMKKSLDKTFPSSGIDRTAVACASQREKDVHGQTASEP